MLSEQDVELIRSARHGDPFSVLGLHADAASGVWARVFLPGAGQVSVVNAQATRMALGSGLANTQMRDCKT